MIFTKVEKEGYALSICTHLFLLTIIANDAVIHKIISSRNLWDSIKDFILNNLSYQIQPDKNDKKSINSIINKYILYRVHQLHFSKISISLVIWERSNCFKIINGLIIRRFVPHYYCSVNLRCFYPRSIQISHYLSNNNNIKNKKIFQEKMYKLYDFVKNTIITITALIMYYN